MIFEDRISVRGSLIMQEGCEVFSQSQGFGHHSHGTNYNHVGLF